jgi:hypothetical protein
VPAQFSWIDQRLVRERYLERIDAHACALYLFLVTVADSRGLSWYGDAAIARRLGIDELRLGRARADLVRVGLVAHRAPLYQVLALDGAAPVQVAPPAPSCCGAHASSPIDARAQLAALHAVLARRP